MLFPGIRPAVYVVLSVLPRAAPSMALLKDSRGRTGPGGGETTAEEDGANPHRTVGGYRAPESGGEHDWISWNKSTPQKKQLLHGK